MIRTAIAALLASTTLAHAQDNGSLSAYLEWIKPDRLVTQLAQFGILALRTQADVVYDDLSVNVAAGETSLTGLRLWPLFDWDEDGLCEITADRIAVNSVPITQVDRYLARVTVTGVGVPGACVPPDQQPMLEMAGLTEIVVPSMTIDFDYDIPSGGLVTRTYAEVEGLATLAVLADFSYAWFDTRFDPDEPEPVLFLSEMRITLENGGGFDALRALLPAGATDPASAGQVAEGAVGAFLADSNRQAALVRGDESEGDPSALSPEQRAFVDQASAAWASFVETPERLIVETGIEESTYLDLLAYDEDPRALFEDLRPVIGVAPRSAEELVEADLLARALAEPEGLTDAERRTVGVALLTGRGAPRSVEQGTDLLRPLADGNDVDAAMMLAEALADSDPGQAYVYALVASAAGAEGAASVMDAVEGELEAEQILAAQSEVAGPAEALDAMPSAAEARRLALAHLSGRGAVRSYELASLYARLSAAMDDAAGRALLDQVDARMDNEAFAAAEARAAEAAIQTWAAR